jgi:hypothetical protein
MKLEILQVPDCPNAAILAARLSELADGWLTSQSGVWS